MKILVLLFKSALSPEDIQGAFEERADGLRGVKGLLQKLHVHDASTGQVGGVYFFDTQENIDAFEHSDLGRSMLAAYKYEGTMTKRIFSVLSELHRQKDHVT